MAGVMRGMTHCAGQEHRTMTDTKSNSYECIIAKIRAMTR